MADAMLCHIQSLRRAGLLKNIAGALRGEVFVLQYIASHNEEALPGEIGSDIGVSSARIAQTLNNMENKGWITRRIDRADRRKIIVKLTPEGRKAAGEHQRMIMEAVTNMLHLLGERDAEEFVRIMGKLTDTPGVMADGIQNTINRTKKARR